MEGLLHAVLARVRAGAYTVSMAVPTIYVKLIQAIQPLEGAQRARLLAGFHKMRLVVSGSAALPASVHHPLRRYLPGAFRSRETLVAVVNQRRTADFID